MGGFTRPYLAENEARMGLREIATQLPFGSLLLDLVGKHEDEQGVLIEGEEVVGILRTVAGTLVDSLGRSAGRLEYRPTPRLGRESLKQILATELIAHPSAPPSEPWRIGVSLTRPRDRDLEF